MVEEFIRIGEFERWARQDTEWKSDLMDEIRAVNAVQARQGERIAVVETEVANSVRGARSTSSRWGAGVGALISAIITGVLSYFSAR